VRRLIKKGIMKDKSKEDKGHRFGGFYFVLIVGQE
jgi:hypothetical protein